MPYIPQAKRDAIGPLVAVADNHINSPGELNYAISRLVHSYAWSNGPVNYEGLNAIIGVLEAAKLEFYRTVVALYEDQKRKDNGPVSILDGIDAETP